ncbi:MAG TPA: sigma-70 family RNA polymerase sigma factor [Mycobacteriales bacterium]|nr:sigma-70 family RNA polymerase sigma factor [Mycobacteriales bacterium]
MTTSALSSVGQLPIAATSTARAVDGAVSLRDPVEFARFYDRALPQVYGYLFNRCGRQPEVAQDLTQEVFTAAVAAIQRDSADVDVAWLIGVARHKLVDHYRARERDDCGLRRVRLQASRDDELARWEVEQTRDAALRALAKLAPEQSAALVLFHLDGLAIAEVAELLGKSVRATESVLVRARRAFRAKFAEGNHD